MALEPFVVMTRVELQQTLSLKCIARLISISPLPPLRLMAGLFQ